VKQAVQTQVKAKAKPAPVVNDDLDWAYPVPAEKPYEDPFLENVDLPALSRLPAVDFDFGSSFIPTYADEEPQFQFEESFDAPPPCTFQLPSSIFFLPSI